MNDNKPRRAFTKPQEFTALEETVSTLGKYSIAFGQHFTPEICYDILAHNNETGEVIRRHYSARQFPAHQQYDRAKECWEDFKQAMTAPRGPSEEDEQDEYRIISPN